MTDSQFMTSGYDKLKKINHQLTQDNVGLIISNNKLSHDVNKLTQDQVQLQQQLEH